VGLPVGVVLSDAAVVLEGVHPQLMEFVGRLGVIHRMLFGEDLVITSGKDGKHVAGSLHALGRAVDLRTKDKTPEQVTVLLVVIAYAAGELPLACFDERQVQGGAHLHLEWHGA
jgi:hypothetical protein